MGREIFNEIQKGRAESEQRQLRRAKKELKNNRDIQEMIKAGIFVGILAVGFVGGCLAFARPSVSNLEKRNLTEKPKFTVATLLDGSYLDNLQTWYADTYPGREGLLTANAAITSLYGIQTNSVHGDIKQADEIPTLPSKETEEAETTTVVETDETDVTETAGTEPESETVTETAESTTETVAPETTEPSESAVPTETATSEVITTQPQGSGSTFEQSYGAVYVQGDRGFGLFYFNLGAADTYIATVNRMQERVGSTANVYCMLIPTATEFYMRDDVKTSLGISSQTDTFTYIYGSLNSSIHPVSIIDTLTAHEGEYIYFNTDHHWTALGAYYAYQQFCSVKGLTAHDLSVFQTMSFSGFLGSFYTDTLAESLKNNPDTVYAYVPMGTNAIQATQQDGTLLNWKIVNDVTAYNAYNKYSTFIAGDNPYSIITNPSITDGSSCVVIKESFGNALVPFLVDHYQTIYIIDYRYYDGDIAQFVNDNKVQDVIFANNADAIGDTAGTNKLSSKIQ